MPNLRGRKNPKDHKREHEKSGSDCDAESAVEFDFGSVEEAEGGSAKEFKSGHGGNNRREEPKSADQGGDESKKGKNAKTKICSDVMKGHKIEDELETANSDKSRGEAETADSIRMFDLETLNLAEGRATEKEPTPRQQGSWEMPHNKQADRKGQGEWNRTGRGARARCEARRNQSEEPQEREESQVELEGEF